MAALYPPAGANMKKSGFLFAFLLVAPAAAYATPGLDEEVYGATVGAGETEIETRYGRLAGGSVGGQDAFVLEAAHGFSSRFRGAALATFAHVPDSRRLETIAFEGVFTLGHIKSLDLDTAVYVETAHNLHGPENLETKLLLEHRRGPFDARLNLIVERAFTSGAPVEFSYAASADCAVADDVTLGAEAFGGLGSSQTNTTGNEHFVGPSAKVELDHAGPGEFEVRAGYLFAIHRTRDKTERQLRVGLEYEF